MNTKVDFKRHCQKIHAKRRFAERFNVSMSIGDIYELINSIQLGKSTLLQKQSARISKHNVFCSKLNKNVTVIYDCTRKTIVTVLPDKIEE